MGGTHDPSHSVLLPSEPFKRPSQRSVAIQATPTLFAFRRGKGSTGGGGLQMYSLWPISWCPVFFSSAHVTMCTYAPVEILGTHTYISIHIYIHTPTRTYTRIHMYMHKHELPRNTYICTHILHPYTQSPPTRTGIYRQIAVVFHT